MNRIELLNQRYSASASIARHGVEIVAVGDPEGARFDRAVRRLIAAIREDGPALWDNLSGVCKALRWRLITQPQPIVCNQRLVELIGEVGRQARRLRPAVANSDLLEEIAASAGALGHPEREPAVAVELLRTCLEAGPDTCVVIAASKSAQIGLTSWLTEHGIRVMTARDLQRDPPNRDQAYVVGPPRFFGPSLTTAPVTEAVTFLVPAWFGDRTVPRTAISPYSDGAIRVNTREFTVGDVSDPAPHELVELEDESACLPQSIWLPREPENREPTSDEVLARKVLLSGNLAMWLDDGERIRTLDPRQPPDERVTYTDVAAVSEGTYLLLREGVTERGALYQAGLAKLGAQASDLDATQKGWKRLLGQRLHEQGHRQVEAELRSVGVGTPERARAWTDQSLIRPKSKQDFIVLLEWLGIPVQPTLENATRLRKLIYRENANITRELEAAASVADLGELESKGYLKLNPISEGFRGIVATRVIAISPYTDIIPRHEARLLFPDRSGQWIE